LTYCKVELYLKVYFENEKRCKVVCFGVKIIYSLIFYIILLRSPDPTPAAVREEPAQKNRFRGGEDWADPWMRSKDDKAKGN
jgi:hypothetical protein